VLPWGIKYNIRHAVLGYNIPSPDVEHERPTNGIQTPPRPIAPANIRDSEVYWLNLHFASTSAGPASRYIAPAPRLNPYIARNEAVTGMNRARTDVP
jgi:hypothetical protein